jgi:large subunit ribosomal protein L13
MKTYSQKASEVQRDWFVVDATDQTLGRLATQIATLLRGKHKPTFSPNLDGGDFVVVVNAEKVRLTGRKEDQKMYYRHSGYPGGFKAIPYRRMMNSHPDRILRFAIKGMLPKTRLGRQQILKLKIYAGPTHPHAAQLPKVYQPRPRG